MSSATKRTALISWLVACIVLVASACDSSRATRHQPSLEELAVPLAGSWKSKRGDDTRWSEPGFDDSDWSTHPFPTTWLEQGYDGVDGFVWFRRRLTLPPGSTTPGILVGPSRFGSYEIFVGGVRIGSYGEADAPPLVPTSQVFRLPPRVFDSDGNALVALRAWRVGWASDRAAAMGTVAESAALGDYATLAARAELEEHRELRADLDSLVLALIFAIVAIYHVLLYRSRAAAEYAWFSVCAFGFAANTLFVSRWIYELTDQVVPVLRLSNASGHLIAAASIQFIWPLASTPIGRVLRGYQLSQVALASVILFVPSPGFIVDTEPVRWLWLLPLLLATVALIARNWRRIEDIRTIGAGLTCLIGVELYEMAVVNFGGETNEPLAAWGFLIFILSLAASLSHRFGRVHDELLDLREKLERRVGERTEALRQSEENYRDLVETMTDLVCVHDLRGRFLSANETMLRKLDLTSQSELSPHSVQDFLLPEVRDLYDPYITAILEHGQVQGLMKVKMRDGRRRILEYSNTLRRSGKDEPVIRAVARDVTERVRAERALKDSERRFRGLVEQAADAFFLYARDGKLSDVNQRACQSLGYSRTELLGLRIVDVEPSPTKSEREELWERIEEGASATVTGTHRRKDGSTFSVELRIGHIKRDGVAHLLALARDITERKRIEDQLKSSEERFKALFEHAPDAYYLSDLSGTFVDGNRAAEKMIGYRKEELIGRNFLEVGLLPAHQLPKAASLLAKNALGQSTGPDEFELRCKHGTLICAEVTTTPLRIDNRALVLGSAREVTERRRAEQKLRKDRAELERLVEDRTLEVVNANRSLQSELAEHHQTEQARLQSERSLAEAQRIARLGDWEWDLEGHEDRWSGEVYRIFGVTPTECGPTREAFLAFVHPDDRNLVQAGFDEAIREGSTSCSFDHRILRPDGSLRTVRERAEITRTDDGEPSRIVGTIQDITEQRALEDQLRYALKMEAVGRLAGGVAHDFNNILTVIQGYGELLKDPSAARQAQLRSIEEIQKASKRASSLTQQLLAFSRKQVLSPTVLNLNSSIIDMDTMLRRILGEDIELVTVLDANLGYVEADKSQIEQVLLNLAVNARDAMPKGGELSIKSSNVVLDRTFVWRHKGAKPGPYALVEVSDTGVGIDPEDIPHLFEPFFTTKDIGFGSGLGLATVYGIVKQSGGYVWVESDLSHGTTFQIYLPRLEHAELPPAPEENLSSDTPLGGSETILVVEDETSIRRLVRRCLESKSYKVLTAQDGTEALRVSDEHDGPIELLITDVIMAGMSGFEVAAQTIERRPEIKVLYMSGYAHDTIRHHGDVDPSVLMRKPFSTSSLARRVRQLLDHESTNHG